MPQPAGYDRQAHVLAGGVVCAVLVAGGALALLGAVRNRADGVGLRFPERELAGPQAGEVQKHAPAETAAAGGADGVVATGRALFLEHCAGCHGQAGDGRGAAALLLFPRPRDFTSGWFKFSSRPAGSLPTDDDLERTIRRGLPGSAMPDWQLLDESERSALGAYLKSLSERWHLLAHLDDPIPIAGGPLAHFPQESEAYLAELRRLEERGRFVYHAIATCWVCHPSYVPEAELGRMLEEEGRPAPGRGNLDQAEPKFSPEYGELIWPTDFPRDRLKGGDAAEDLFRVIAAGVTGTAMPTWYGGLGTDDPIGDLWALAYYVKRLNETAQPCGAGDGRP